MLNLVTHMEGFKVCPYVGPTSTVCTSAKNQQASYFSLKLWI